MRTLLLVTAVVCCWTTEVKLQTEDKPGSSTINGTAVYADTGRPLRHALVTLFYDQVRLQQSTITDLRGRFTFTHLEEGNYRLTLQAPGLLQPENNKPRVEILELDTQWPEKSELVTEITLNGTDSIDLKVAAVRGGVITGRVTTEDDQPLVNADIKLLRRENGKWVPVWRTWVPDEFKQGGDCTDANGVYRIAALPSGDYIVRASEPFVADDKVPGDEDAYGNGSFMAVYYPAATTLKDAQVVSVVAGSESTGIDVRLPERPTHTLSGTVKFPGLGQPGTDVNITVERSDEIGFATAIHGVTAYADSEGKWRVPGLPAGDYLVTIAGRTLTVDMTGGHDDKVEILQALSKRIPIRIKEEKETILNTTLTFGAQVKGRLTLNGKPLKKEWLLAPSVMSADKPVNSAEDELDGLFFLSTLMGVSDIFRITALTPGSYWFSLAPDEDYGLYVKSVTRKGVDLMHAPFKVTEDQIFDDVEVTLADDLARVEGHVTLPKGGAKLSAGDLIVIVAPANDLTERFNNSRIVDADEKGKIAFRSGPGEYLIAALPASEYEKIEPRISNTYFEKNADKFLRIKLRAGEKVKALAVPMMKE
jgi:hypothetical protein